MNVYLQIISDISMNSSYNWVWPLYDHYQSVTVTALGTNALPM